MKYSELPKNPVETSILMLGCRWRVLIVRELLSGAMRFCELQKALKTITKKVLITKLREMEDLGLIKREEFQEKVKRVEYSLTDIGYSLTTIIQSYNEWGKDYKRYVRLLEKRQTK